MGGGYIEYPGTGGGGGGGGGTVTSVGLALPASLFNVSGSPVTTSGTLFGAFANISANLVLAGPTSGGPATPTMRLLVAADIPNPLNQNTTGTAGNITATSNSTLTTLSALSILGSQVTGDITGNAGNITATSNSTLTTLSSLSLPGTQVTGNISGTASNITAASNSTLVTLSALSLPINQLTGTLSVSNGGTGKTTSTAAFNALSPMTTLGDLIYGGAAGAGTRLPVGSAGQVLTISGGIPSWQNITGTGTVTSVAMTVPSFLSVSGSPITGAGTLTVTLSTESANTIFAGPTSGGALAPTFRSMVNADLPAAIVAVTSVTSPFFQSATSNPALSGEVRLANTDTIAWRDSTNSVDYSISNEGGTTNRFSFNNAILSRLDQNAATQSILTNESAGAAASTQLTLRSFADDFTFTAFSVAAGALAQINAGAGFTAGMQISTPVGPIHFYSGNTNSLTLNANQSVTMPFYGAGAAVFSSAGLLSSVAPGTSGNLLTSNGSTWISSAFSLPTNSVTNSELAQATAYTYKGNNTGSTANVGDYQSLILGTPGYTGLGVSAQLTGSYNSYVQCINANSDGGGSSSADFIVSNNLSTDSAYYGDFGINSSTFAGSGSLNLPNATYLYSESGDLVLGTGTSNAIHFVINGDAIDAMSISTTDAITLGKSSSTSIHQVNGGMQVTTRTITASLTVDTTMTDYIIFCNQSAGITITLPAPTNGRMLQIFDTTGNAVTNNISLAPNSTEKISGLAATKVFSTNWGGWTVVSNGTDWFVT